MFCLSVGNSGLTYSVVKEHCPHVKILELYQPHLGKAVEDADSWLEVPADVPSDLAERVDELARNGKSDVGKRSDTFGVI